MADRFDMAAERLLAAMAARGIALARARSGAGATDRLRAAVAPMRLPQQLERMWELSDTWPPGVIDTLDLPPVGRALHTRLHAAQQLRGFPVALLELDIGGDEYRLIELDGPDDTDGGAIWAGDFYDWSLRAVAPSLAQLLETVALAWERGIVTPVHPEGGALWARFEPDAWRELKAQLLPPPDALPRGPANWKPKWLALQGLDARDLVPRGATVTIADLRARGIDWVGPETIHVQIAGLATTGDVVAQATDGTGTLSVYIAATADRFALININGTFELDVQPHRPGDDAGVFDAWAIDADAIAVRLAQ